MRFDLLTEFLITILPRWSSVNNFDSLAIKVHYIHWIEGERVPWYNCGKWLPSSLLAACNQTDLYLKIFAIFYSLLDFNSLHLVINLGYIKNTNAGIFSYTDWTEMNKIAQIPPRTVYALHIYQGHFCRMFYFSPKTSNLPPANIGI